MRKALQGGVRSVTVNLTKPEYDYVAALAEENTNSKRRFVSISEMVRVAVKFYRDYHECIEHLKNVG